MNDSDGSGTEALSEADLRRVEARIGAQIQEVNARLILHDGRFAALSDRLRQTDRRTEAFSVRLDSRLRAVDRRFDEVESRLDAADARHADARDQLVAAMRAYRAALGRTTILALAATLIVTGIMTAATMWIVA